MKTKGKKRSFGKKSGGICSEYKKYARRGKGEGLIALKEKRAGRGSREKRTMKKKKKFFDSKLARKKGSQKGYTTPDPNPKWDQST